MSNDDEKGRAPGKSPRPGGARRSTVEDFDRAADKLRGASPTRKYQPSPDELQKQLIELKRRVKRCERENIAAKRRLDALEGDPDD